MSEYTLKNGTVVRDPRLGRIVQFDERSRNYPIRATLTPQQMAEPRSYTWAVGNCLNQGNGSSCVGHAWAHELLARPVCFKKADHPYALQIYNQAKKVDEWPGVNYEGTSVLAGAKVVTALGHITEYRWAFGLDDLKLAVGYKGPVVLGLNWYDGMMDPDTDGYIHPTGASDGGHAIMCNGVDIKRKFFKLWNSWGPSWGPLGGACRLSFDDMNRLLHENGESCIPMGRKQMNA